MVQLEDLVILEAYADAYYSGNNVTEHAVIRRSTYDENKDDIDSISIGYSELDGKHSYVDADINIKIIDKDELENYNWNELEYGDKWDEQLNEIFDCDSETKIVNDILDSLDILISVTVTIKKSQQSKLDEFINTLKTK